MNGRISHNYSYQDCLDNSKKVVERRRSLGGQEIRFHEAFPAEQAEWC